MSDIIRKQQAKQELAFLRQLFLENLPINEDKKPEIEQYFNSIEKVICSKDGNIEREEFPPDDPSVCGKREYRYYSVDKFKELASRHQYPAIGQDMGHTESKSTDVHAKQDNAAKPQDMEHFQEYSLFAGTFDADHNSYNLPRELDSRNTGQLSDDQTRR
jgi:hypothetical protein